MLQISAGDEKTKAKIEAIFDKKYKWLKPEWVAAITEADKLPELQALRQRLILDSPKREFDKASNVDDTASSVYGDGLDPAQGWFRQKRRNALNWEKFGPYLINKNKLAANELSLIGSNGVKPDLIRNQIISDEIKKCITQFMDGGVMNTLNLNPEEIAYLKWLWATCKLDGPKKRPQPNYIIRPKYPKSMKLLKERAKVLIGECVAGNDNKEIITELKGVIHRLKELGCLSLKEIKALDEFIE